MTGRIPNLLGVALVACAMVGAVSAHADTAAPAYAVEPRSAPPNSTQIGASGSTAPAAAPAAAPASTVSSAPPAVPAGATPAAAPAPPPGAQTDVADDDPRALQDFKPQLDPYGNWVQDPKYGTVWVPDRTVVGEDFSPYVTNGHWALDTNDNWVWVSDYPFGDVVFHYGRWAWTSYGWSWIPGYQYAPAWVDWRVPDGDYPYLGWSPMPPSWIWWGGVGLGLWWAPPYYWAFCPSRYVFARYPGYYVVHNAGYVRTIAGYTRHYVPASARVGGPSLAAARIPRGAAPTSRIAASAHFNGYATHTLARTGAYAGGARSYGAATSYRGGTYAPSRTLGTTSYAGARSYGTASMYGGSRVYSSPRAYSGSYGYGTASRVYAPSSHVYSSPAYHTSSFSSPHYSVSHYGGGGYSVSHSYGGGGSHFGGGGGGHFGGGGGGHFGGGGHGGGHR